MRERRFRYAFARFPFLYWFLPFLLIIPFILQNCTDWYYMIPTGEYIIKNGFPQTNPFNVVEGLHIIIQNWVFCVAVYLCSLKIGLTGIQLLGCAEYLTFSYTCFRMAKRAGYRNDASGWLVMAANIVMASVMGAARPAILTACALLFVMDAFFQYGNGNRKRLFVVLPAAAVFVTNIQSSNLFFLFCPAMAYLVAALCERRAWQEKLRTSFAILMASMISILAAACLNPYGTENLFYLFLSLGHVEAFELDSVMLLSGRGVLLLSAAYTALIVLWRRMTCGRRLHAIGLYRIFLLIGFYTLSMTCIRNVLFLIPAFFYVWEEVYDLCCTSIHTVFHWKPVSRFAAAWESIPILFRRLIIFVLTGSIWLEACGCGFAFPGPILTQVAKRTDDFKLIDTLRTSGRKVEGASVFPGDAYFELLGMKVLIEPRGEISDSPINHVADLWTQYKYLEQEASVEEIREFFEEYPFDYYLAVPGSKMDLYFTMSREYRKVDQTEETVMYESR